MGTEATITNDEHTTGSSTGIASLLVGADEAASRSGISKSTWDRLSSTGRNPRPIKLGARVLWRVSDLEFWVDAGCPARDVFERLKEQAAGRQQKGDGRADRR